MLGCVGDNAENTLAVNGSWVHIMVAWLGDGSLKPQSAVSKWIK